MSISGRFRRHLRSDCAFPLECFFGWENGGWVVPKAGSFCRILGEVLCNGCCGFFWCLRGGEER
jgi:hypothetical protein